MLIPGYVSFENLSLHIPDYASLDISVTLIPSYPGISHFRKLVLGYPGISRLAQPRFFRLKHQVRFNSGWVRSGRPGRLGQAKLRSHPAHIETGCPLRRSSWNCSVSSSSSETPAAQQQQLLLLSCVFKFRMSSSIFKLCGSIIYCQCVEVAPLCACGLGNRGEKLFRYSIQAQ